MMMKKTCAKVKSNAAKEVVTNETIKVPDGQFNTAVLELQPSDALEHKRVIPGRVTVAFDDGALVCRRPRSIRQQTTTARHNATEHLYAVFFK